MVFLINVSVVVAGRKGSELNCMILFEGGREVSVFNMADNQLGPKTCRLFLFIFTLLTPLFS